MQLDLDPTSGISFYNPPGAWGRAEGIVLGTGRRLNTPPLHLSLAHELYHARQQRNYPNAAQLYATRTGQFRMELEAWLAAFVQQGHRAHLRVAADCLASYGFRTASTPRLAYRVLTYALDRLGVPRGDS